MTTYSHMIVVFIHLKYKEIQAFYLCNNLLGIM